MPINTFSVISASEVETLSSQLTGDGLYQLVKKIDNIIKFQAMQNKFQCDIIVSTFDGTGAIPEEVYTLTKIYQSRGFNTVYNGNVDTDLETSFSDAIVISPSNNSLAVSPDNGTMTIKWYAPRMTYQDVIETPEPAISRIPDLGFNFYAHTIYLCQTSGIDLRQFTATWILRQVDVLLKKAAIEGLNYVNYMGPEGLFQKVSTQSLVTLYTDVTDALTAAGYSAGFINGQLNITWVFDSSAPALPQPGDGTADPASSIDLSFVFTQTVPSSSWVIVHDLGKYVSVTVVDTNNNEIFGSVSYINENAIQIEFSVPVSGKAYLN